MVERAAYRFFFILFFFPLGKPVDYRWIMKFCDEENSLDEREFFQTTHSTSENGSKFSRQSFLLKLVPKKKKTSAKNIILSIKSHQYNVRNNSIFFLVLFFFLLGDATRATSYRSLMHLKHDLPL
jgi:hypothetical protein